MSHRKSDLGIPCTRKSAKVALGRVLKSRLFGNRWLPQTTCANNAGSSGDLLPPSPPAEKTTTSKPATIARIVVGGRPFYRHAPGLPDGREKRPIGCRCLSWLSS